MKPRVLCAIPARYGSTRFPGKPLALVKGVPLVMWAYRRAAECGAFDRVVVATDDRRILDAVAAHGGVAVMTSPHHQSGTDRINEAIRTEMCHYVVNLQADEPDVPAQVLRRFAGRLTSIDDNSLLTCISNATINEAQNPNVVKVVTNARGEALYFSRSCIPFDRQDRKQAVARHTGMYGFTREGLRRFCSFPPGRLETIEALEQLRALEQGMKIICVTVEYTGKGIDTKEDLDEFIRALE